MKHASGQIINKDPDIEREMKTISDKIAALIIIIISIQSV